MPAAEQYKVGQEIYRPPDDKTKWLVVRIVERDTALVVNDQGQTFITTESYVMLKSEKGEIDFVLLLHESGRLEGDFVDELTIRPLPSLWRKHNGK